MTKRTPRETEKKIVEAYTSGVAMSEIVSTFGVSNTTVRKAVKRLGGELRAPAWAKSVRHDFFEDINDEESAYWLGFVAADGCVHRGYVKLGLSSVDDAHVESFRKALSSEHKLYRTTHSTTLAIGSPKMVEDLRKFGIAEGKTLNLDINLSNVKEGLHRHFWRGFVDGDGCWFVSVRDRPEVSVSIVATRAMCEKFRDWARQYVKTKAAIREHPSGIVCNYRIGGVWPAAKVGDELYRDSTVFLPRKRAKFEEGVQALAEYQLTCRFPQRR